MEQGVIGESRQGAALRRARAALVGGVLTQLWLPPEVALVIARGQGSHVWDLDGREYLDFVMGSGPLILGHAHPAVVEAVTEQVRRGSHYYVLNEPAIELAEEIVRAVPCAEKVRFVGTGSEAGGHALRLARAFTGRERILKLEGGYHGHTDHTILSCTPSSVGGYPIPKPDSAGLPSSVLATTLVAPFNDTETTLEIIQRHARDLAAVIVEPLQRVIRPKPGFLEAVRQATRDLGIVLIFDEVVTAFRLAYGGAQERYGVVPDLATLAKAIGGGHPMAAVVGRADIMAHCDPDPGRKAAGKYALVSGTFNGNPISATAGLATLAELRKPGAYERLNGVGERLRSALEAVLAEAGIPGQVAGDGSVRRLLFTDRPIESYQDVLSADRKLGARVGLGLLKRGFYVNPGEKIYLSLAHTDEDIDRFAAAVAETLREVKKES